MANNPNLIEDNKKTRFTPTNQPANRGRKPSKLRKYLKENNLGADDIRLIAGNIMHKTKEELRDLIKSDKVPILVAGAAAALLKDMVKGQTATLQWLADRAFGKSKESIQVSGEIGLYALTAEERRARIDELLKKRDSDE